MSLGIIMKGLNALHFRNRLDFLFEFIPQILMMLALFGWMDLLIVAKWLYPKDVERNYTPDNNIHSDFNHINKSPAIITTMIDMFLKFADNTIVANGESKEQYYYLFPGQKSLSIIMLIIALAAAPTMLYVKPMILKGRIKAQQHSHVEIEHERIDYGKGGNSDYHEQIREILKNEGSHEGHHSFGDIFIHQMIETIEFVLGTVSNTASYLRLWALSLAHSQLATVFLELILVKYGGGFHTHGIVSSIMVNIYLLLNLYSSSFRSSCSSQSPSASSCAWTPWSASFTLYVFTGSSSRTSSTRVTDTSSRPTHSEGSLTQRCAETSEDNDDEKVAFPFFERRRLVVR